MVARVPRLPLVTIRVLIDAGASSDPLEHAGLAALTAQLLAEGTARADGARLAEEFESLGGALSVAAAWDGIQAHTTVLGERFEPALRLLAEVVSAPEFPEREVARLKAEREAELLELRSEPRGLADERFTAFAYAADSRFAFPEAGSERTVDSLHRELCVAFHTEHFRPAGMTVIVVGDIDRERAVVLVEDVLGQPGGESRLRPDEVVRAARAHRAVQVIGRRDAPQTEVRIGHLGPPRSHPDYFSIVVMNAILGGVFNSRINLNLRERNGYCYGASSRFEWRRQAGPFVIATAVATDVTAAAIRESVFEVERMRAAPPSDSEMSLVTSYLEGVFPIRFETTAAIAAALTTLKVFDLPHDYYDRYRDHIRGVTAADVLQAAERHLHPEQLQVVVVGDPERIGPSLVTLGMGPVLHATPDNGPVSAR
jgi:zinc protease